MVFDAQLWSFHVVFHLHGCAFALSFAFLGSELLVPHGRWRIGCEAWCWIFPNQRSTQRFWCEVFGFQYEEAWQVWECTIVYGVGHKQCWLSQKSKGYLAKSYFLHSNACKFVHWKLRCFQEIHNYHPYSQQFSVLHTPEMPVICWFLAAQLNQQHGWASDFTSSPNNFEKILKIKRWPNV